MPNPSDNFNRSDGALGTSASGHLWQLLAGSVTVKSSRGFANNSARAIAVLDAGASGQDATITAKCGSGGGYAIYFRVSDANNWWRLSVRQFYSSTFVPTGGYRCTITYADGRPQQSFNSGSDVSGTNGFGDSTSCSPNGYYTGDYYWYLYLDKCVAGTVTNVRSVYQGTALSTLTVTCQGTSIAGYSSASPTTPHWTVTDSFSQGSTLHGIGYDNSTSYGNTDGLDDFLIAPFNTAPTAPTLFSPANAATTDLAATPTFDWIANDPDTADVQAAYAFRRKIAGAALYEWWNAGISAWQSTEVFNPGLASDVTFPSNAWANGVTYNWSAATRDSGGLTGPYSGDFTVTGSQPPVVTVTAPSGVVSNTSRPVITWSYADPENSPQETYRVRVFDAATFGGAGFDPATSTAVAGGDSSQATSAAARSWQTSEDLVNDTSYRAYVQVTQTGQQPSVWKWSGFTVSLTPPLPPILSALDDPAGGQVVLTVTGQDVGPTFTSSNTTFAVEYSDDGGQTWVGVRFAEAVVPDPGSRQAVVIDREAPPGRARTYRARTSSTL